MSQLNTQTSLDASSPSGKKAAFVLGITHCRLLKILENTEMDETTRSQLQELVKAISLAIDGIFYSNDL